MPGARSNTVRVLIADDDRLFRRVMGQVFGALDGVEIVGQASDGAEAIAMASRLQPDLVTLDLQMPVLGGFDALAKIKAQTPSPRVLVVTAYGAEAATKTIKALTAGASDFALKPYSSEAAPTLSSLENQIRRHVDALRDLKSIRPIDISTSPVPISNATTDAAAGATQPIPPIGTPTRVGAIVIAASTGGPNALTEVFRSLPGNLGTPIFVVQHIPKGFTSYLAKMLDDAGPLKVVEAQSNTEAKPNHAYLAPGGQHMTVTGTETRPIIRLNSDPMEHSVRPAADVLLRGIEHVFGGHALVAVLTGMGRDGAAGASRIASLGGRVVVQDRETSTVWGMPGAVVSLGVPCDALPLEQIGRHLASLSRQS